MERFCGAATISTSQDHVPICKCKLYAFDERSQFLPHCTKVSKRNFRLIKSVLDAGFGGPCGR
jgi:hypothetical protein